MQEEFFEEKDVNSDGKLNWMEFQAAMQEDSHPDEMMGDTAVAEAFKLADLDKDSYVSLEEWMGRFIHGQPQMPQYVDGLGKGTDYHISAAEIEEQRIEARIQFDKMDKDQDGLIVQEEVHQMLLNRTEDKRSPGIDEAHVLSVQLTRELDKNKDGKVTFTEFFDTTFTDGVYGAQFPLYDEIGHDTSDQEQDSERSQKAKS